MNLLNDCVVELRSSKKSTSMIISLFCHCHCEICEWLIFGTLFSNFPAFVQIYAWFVMHCRNHYRDNHPNHVMINHKAWTRLFADFMTCCYANSWKSTTPLHYKLVIYANSPKQIAIYSGNGTTLKHNVWAVLHSLNSSHGEEWYFMSACSPLWKVIIIPFRRQNKSRF